MIQDKNVFSGGAGLLGPTVITKKWPSITVTVTAKGYGNAIKIVGPIAGWKVVRQHDSGEEGGRLRRWAGAS